MDGQTSDIQADPAMWTSLDAAYVSDGTQYATLRGYFYALTHLIEWLDATHIVEPIAPWPLERVQVTSGQSSYQGANGTCIWQQSAAFSSLPEVHLEGSNTSVRCKILSGSELTAFLNSFSGPECGTLLDGIAKTLVHIRALFPAESGECK